MDIGDQKSVHHAATDLQVLSATMALAFLRRYWFSCKILWALCQHRTPSIRSRALARTLRGDKQAFSDRLWQWFEAKVRSVLRSADK